MSRAAPLAVLGGGFGGLAAAIALAAAGEEVVLLEREPSLGGKAGEVRRDGFRFDTGPSVVTLPGVLHELFAAAGRELPLALEPLERLCRYRYPSGRVWDVMQDVEASAGQLSAAEGDAYRKLLDDARRIYQGAAPTFVYGPPPGPLRLAAYGLRHGLSAHPTRSLPQLIAHRGASGELATFFLRFATYFGADPFRAPAVLHNIAWVELGLGVVAPEGGVRGLVRALEGLARELGVDIRCGVGVEALEHRGDRVVAVRANGAELPVSGVVSGLDRVRSVRLLGRHAPAARRPPSLSGLVLLLGVDGRRDALAEHTIDFAAGDPGAYRAEFDAIRAGRFPAAPTLYLHTTSRREPRDAPDGAEAWFVMANAPALPEPPEAEPEAQAERERVWAERMLDALDQRELIARRDVRFVEIRGPAHLARLGHRGSIYGAAPHGLLGTLRPPQTLPGLRNLTLGGGTVFPGGGIPLALLSGRGAARLLRERLGRT